MATPQTPADAYAVMQGTGGLGQGLTTYPDDPDPDVKYTHDCVVALSDSGGCVLHGQGMTYQAGAEATQGQRFMIWMPLPGATPPAPPPRPPEVDNTLPEPDPPPEPPAP